MTVSLTQIGTSLFIRWETAENDMRLVKLHGESHSHQQFGSITNLIEMKRLTQKDGERVLDKLALYWKDDGDVFVLPRVIELVEDGKGVLYWLKQGTTISLKGTPYKGFGFEDERVKTIRPQLTKVLAESNVAKCDSESRLNFKQATHLAQESSIEWLRDPKGFPYLRQDFETSSRRDSDLAKRYHKTGELIGYAILSPTTKAFEGRYFRRFFWFKTDGKDPYSGTNAPGEAVKVSTIAKGIPAERGRDK
jgi:hypothetical protein